jgi:hypothetical protein
MLAVFVHHFIKLQIPKFKRVVAPYHLKLALARKIEFVAAPGGGEKWRAPIVDIAQNRAVLGVGLMTLIGEKYEVFCRQLFCGFSTAINE